MPSKVQNRVDGCGESWRGVQVWAVWCGRLEQGEDLRRKWHGGGGT